MKKNSIRIILALWFSFLIFSCGNNQKIAKQHHKTFLRAPAYPLVTIDPYTSAWSMADQLYDDQVRHWTGKVHSLIGAVRVDGEVFRFMGKEEVPLKEIIPMSKHAIWEGEYTETEPIEGWEQPEFDAKLWKTGKAPFGTPNSKEVNTVWETANIWVRRSFTFPEILDDQEYYLIYSHDDDFELYLNGTEIVNTGNKARRDVVLKIPTELLKKGGENVIAAHCWNRVGWAYVDFGIYTKSLQKEVFTKTATQKEVNLSATQTHYSFACGPVDLQLKFTSPLLPDDLDLLSRPISYIDYELNSNDGNNHDVEIYFEMTPQWAVDEMYQEVEVSKEKVGSVQYLKTGTNEQPVLEKHGDNVRIDWGYAYLAAATNEQSELNIGEYFKAKETFVSNGIGEGGEAISSAKMTEKMPVLSYFHTLGKVNDQSTSGYLMIGYDDLVSIQYFGDNLPAWWTQGGKVTIDDEFEKAVAEHDQIMEKCVDFDNRIWEDAVNAGGKKYADLCVLAFRQAIAAHKLTKDNQGNILFLSKENFSNGSIGTVDVTYPSAPLFLKYNPELLKGMMNPIFYYSESGKWTKPFAAHDVGTYPKANGQTYGGDMPIEECGNMLIMAAAIAKMEGNANYAKAHWEVLTTWANYLKENGLDPENQLCTDDFAGHFAHNTNLSIKAIMGIAGYGMLAEMLGKKEIANTYNMEASQMASEWEKMANDGDHYRLTFDKPGTWSQKYNMVWDKLLGFGIFPKEISEKEISYYLSKQNTYGLPLDNRKTYTKSDWIVWTATLANDQETFQKFIDPLHAYVTNTPDRVPMSDWYETPNAEKVGFQARSVVGGYFIKILDVKP
ncbi:glutaminase family protein [Flexithrix dorotheae]|uniref:glutaminase family protein n=1 Tax=Flexithrix dorotheae TaxID=70993 RepID=UPI0004762FCB|nr:glutaminase family protein [Flexithrix dorotheae]